MVTTAEKNALNGYWAAALDVLLKTGNQEPTDEQIRESALVIRSHDPNRNRSSSLASSSSSGGEYETPDTSFEIVPEQDANEQQASKLSYQKFRSLILASPFPECNLKDFLAQFKHSDLQAIYLEYSSFPLFSWLVEELNYPVFHYLVRKFYPIDTVLDLLQEVDSRGYNVLHCWANGISIKASNSLTPTIADLSLLQEIKSFFTTHSQLEIYQQMCSFQSDEQTPIDLLHEAYNVEESTHYHQFIELLTTPVAS